MRGDAEAREYLGRFSISLEYCNAFDLQMFFKVQPCKEEWLVLMHSHAA